ncbi:MAG: EAL domain-containing protein [Pseudomonadota bacterium]
MGQLGQFISDGDAGGEDLVDRALRTVRSYLQMEVAYLSEFVDNTMVIRAVDAPGFEAIAHPGAAFDRDYTYCNKICAGDLPEVIPDTGRDPLAATLPITRDIPIGSHISLPIRRADGSIYGMLCCLSRDPHPSLNDRDLEMMRAFADISATQVNDSIARRVRLETLQDRIDGALRERRFDIAFQPICNLADSFVSGFEALSRFRSDPYRPPNLWFAEAEEIGRGQELELAVIEQALAALPDLPAHTYLSVDASADTVASGALLRRLTGVAAERLVVEITEHAEITDIAALQAAMAALRIKGARIAIDDCGAGYSGLQQVVRLRPDIIKLDISLTAGIDEDRALRSLAAAMVHYAGETDAVIVAEGIETEGELRTLRSLGIHKGQGYLLGRPQLLDRALEGMEDAKRMGAA